MDSNMIGILVLSSSFMVLILIAILILAWSVKKWAYQKEEINQKRFEDLSKRIDETQKLFKTEVTEILNNFQKLLK